MSHKGQAHASSYGETLLSVERLGAGMMPRLQRNTSNEPTEVQRQEVTEGHKCLPLRVWGTGYVFTRGLYNLGLTR